MISEIAGILTGGGLSTIAGSVIALIGTQMTKKNERLAKEKEYEHDFKMAELDIRNAQLEFDHAVELANKQIEETETEGAIAKDIEATKAFKESIKSQALMYGSSLVDGVRGLIRPVITCYLLIAMSYIAFSLHQAVGGLTVFPDLELFELYKQAINQIFFLGATAVTWWFGSRPSSVRKNG